MTAPPPPHGQPHDQPHLKLLDLGFDFGLRDMQMAFSATQLPHPPPRHPHCLSPVYHPAPSAPLLVLQCKAPSQPPARPPAAANRPGPRSAGPPAQTDDFPPISPRIQQTQPDTIARATGLRGCRSTRRSTRRSTSTNTSTSTRRSTRRKSSRSRSRRSRRSRRRSRSQRSRRSRRRSRRSRRNRRGLLSRPLSAARLLGRPRPAAAAPARPRPARARPPSG